MFILLWNHLKGRVTLPRVVIALIAIPVVVYVFREATRDVLIVDSFTVPKRFEDGGLSAEVISNRIGDAINEIERATSTRMRKETLGSQDDENIPLP
jgi:hypothetical protein